ncbi:hypothetical protein GBA52_014779 [Prunus armeniaca]|nr:hypothetical protein GBA52_014779 [Prunus armeniaca]
MTKPPHTPPTSPPDLPCKVRLLLSLLTIVINTVCRSNGTINTPIPKQRRRPTFERFC